jgi:hypothetical protein
MISQSHIESVPNSEVKSHVDAAEIIGPVIRFAEQLRENDRFALG